MQRDAFASGARPPAPVPVSPPALSVAEADGVDDDEVDADVGGVTSLEAVAVTVRVAVGVGVLDELQPASTTPSATTAGARAQRAFVFMPLPKRTGTGPHSGLYRSGTVDRSLSGFVRAKSGRRAAKW